MYKFYIKMKNNIIFSPHYNLPSLHMIQDCGYRILHTLPKPMRPSMQHLYICVDNYPDHQTLQSLNIVDKYDLLGLYRGGTVMAPSEYSSSNHYILLYRCPLIKYSLDNSRNLFEIVKDVIMQEVKHSSFKK